MTEAPSDPRPEAALFAQVAGHRFALDARFVLSVRGVPHVTRLPHQPAHMLGVFQHEGRIVPLLDLLRFSGEPAPAQDPRIVILESGDHVLGVLFTMVEDVLPLHAARIDPAETGRLPQPLVSLVGGQINVAEDPSQGPKRPVTKEEQQDPRIQALLEQAPDWFVRIQDPDDDKRHEAARKRLESLCAEPGGVALLRFDRLWKAARDLPMPTPAPLEGSR